MKLVIPGGSGQVGMVLARAFASEGHEVVILSRKPGVNDRPWRVVPWDGRTLGSWTAEIEGADALINLAGRSVNCRYTAHNRQAIMNSRLDSTRAVGAAIDACQQPPGVWLQASTATIYSHRYDAANDEATGILGGAEPNVPDTWRFSIDVAKRWESAAGEAKLKRTRLVLLRSAMVMSPDSGGVFDTLLALVRWRLGGRHGDGTQFVSWIHEFDFVGAVSWLLQNPLAGPVNLASPCPLPNGELMHALRAAWANRGRARMANGADRGSKRKRPVWGLPAPRALLELGTFLLRSETELVLKSRRVTPGRLLESGFDFRYPQWEDAAAELCSRWPLKSPTSVQTARTAGRLSPNCFS